MKILVQWLNESRTRAEVTIVPSWLGRLFGRKVRRGSVVRSGYRWDWDASGKMVDEIFGVASYVEYGPITTTLTREQSAPTVNELPMAIIKERAP